MKDLLMMRLILLNLAGAAGLVWAYWAGFVQMVIAGDSSYICMAITLVFAVGMVSVFTRARKVSKVLNDVHRGRFPDVNGAKFLAKGEHIGDLASWCATLGLFGTVIGLIMMVAGIDADSLSNIDGVRAAIGPLIAGWGVALYTTAVGAVFGLWLELNRRVLHTATVSMIEDARA